MKSYLNTKETSEILNSIHPSAVIGPEVQLGDNNIIGPNCVLLGPLMVGDENWIGPGVAIGTPPQSRGYEHTRPWDQVQGGSGITVGSRNIIREFATVQSPTKGKTVIGDDCFIMTQAHVPHDAWIGSRVTMANSTHIAGHCVIQDDVNLGLASTIHQFTVIGRGAMVGMGSIVTRHVPPYALTFGSPSKPQGCNRVGMLRQGYEDSVIDSLDKSLKGYVSSNINDYQTLVPSELHSIFNEWVAAVAKVRD